MFQIVEGKGAGARAGTKPVILWKLHAVWLELRKVAGLVRIGEKQEIKLERR